MAKIDQDLTSGRKFCLDSLNTLFGRGEFAFEREILLLEGLESLDPLGVFPAGPNWLAWKGPREVFLCRRDQFADQFRLFSLGMKLQVLSKVVYRRYRVVDVIEVDKAGLQIALRGIGSRRHDCKEGTEGLLVAARPEQIFPPLVVLEAGFLHPGLVAAAAAQNQDDSCGQQSQPLVDNSDP